MMKRLLVLTMVLAMAPFASAVLSIGVGGDPNPLDSEYTIGPSDLLILNIRSSGDFAPVFMLIVDNALGSISGGFATANAGVYYNMNSYVPYYAYDVGIIPWPGYPTYYPATVNGISWILGYDTYISGIVFIQIGFHCESPDDAVIGLWQQDGFGDWLLVDELTIHQTPEPLTIALLGLGGLFLRRRK